VGVEEEILTALRRVSRAVSMHSRALLRSSGLTWPQSLVLKAISGGDAITVGELARRVNLSQATMTDILLRLEHKGLVTRVRAEDDRRRVLVKLTSHGSRLSKRMPPLFQDQFLRRLNRLQPWEQTQLLYVLQRLGAMMDADDLATIYQDNDDGELSHIEPLEPVLSPNRT